MERPERALETLELLTAGTECNTGEKSSLRDIFIYITHLESQLGGPDEMLKALAPFAAFGAVIQTAGEDNGYAWVNLYSGESKPKSPSQEDGDEVNYDNLNPDGCVVGVNAGWSKVPATYCGPVLQVKHFLSASETYYKHRPPDVPQPEEKPAP